MAEREEERNEEEEEVGLKGLMAILLIIFLVAAIGYFTLGAIGSTIGVLTALGIITQA